MPAPTVALLLLDEYKGSIHKGRGWGGRRKGGGQGKHGKLKGLEQGVERGESGKYV